MLKWSLAMARLIVVDEHICLVRALSAFDRRLDMRHHAESEEKNRVIELWIVRGNVVVK
jgi:hypothetical protein